MKTIEEEAELWAKYQKEIRLLGQRVSTCRSTEDFQVDAFIAGAEFALEWIIGETDDKPLDKLCDLSIVSNWVAYDWNDISSRPPKYGKYLITRKDGKIHWETWNGSGWAYNHNEIRYWAEIKPPCL